jgi:phage terminase large subunit-like protein
VADSKQTLNKEWLKFYTGEVSDGCNIYLLVDPASEKKKSSDYTCAMVIGLGTDNNYRILDMVRDRLNLKERGDMVFTLHRKWNPRGVGYEKYGMQADVEYIKERMKSENYYFEITELGGQMPKPDRIKRLVPSLEQGRWILPETLFRTNYEGKLEDLVEIYINDEYTSFPVSVHDDMLDCQSRIVETDMQVIWPKPKYKDEHDRYSRKKRVRSTSAWSS